MKKFTLTIPNTSDIPAVLHESIGRNMGSLRASRVEWASLLNAMGIDLHFAYHQRALQRGIPDGAAHIVRSAVPHVGDPHPMRATVVEGADHNCVAFTTPNGVRVSLFPTVVEEQNSDTGIDITIDFGRDSIFLATLVLADMFRRVPAAIALLAEVAQEAAGAYADV